MSFNNQGVFGFDISTWQDAPTTPAVVDFQKMKNYGAAFCIIRAGQGNFIDPDWNTHIQNSTGVIPNAAYWYYDPRFSPTVQANTCLQALNGKGIKRLWIDLEFTWAGDYTASIYWKDFRERIKAGGYKTGVYTRKTWWDDKVGTLSTYFAQDPLWVAQYNTTLTLIPKGWTSAMIWQDGTPSIGHAAGVESEEIDHNFWNSDFSFAAEWGTVVIPPSDTITQPHDGMTRISGIRHGYKFELFITDPSQVNYESVCLSPIETPSSVARRKGATLAVNGGEWDRVSDTKDYTVDDGFICHARISAVPSLMILGDGTPFINHTATADVRHALSGLRYLIQAGAIKTYLYGTEPQYTEGHARSIHGINNNGHHMVLQSSGGYPNQGLTLLQAAEIMRSYGAFIAFDSGGGGDVACILDGESLIVPENVVNGVHFERPLPNVFLVYAQGAPMPETFDYYVYSSTVDDHAIRTGPNVTYPYIAGTYSKWFHGTLAKGKATAAEIYTFTADLIYNGAVVGKTGDVWRKIYDNAGHAVDGWVADIHMGKVTITNRLLVPANPDPEPGAKPETVDIVLTAGSTIIVKDAAGNVIWTGTA